MPISLRYMRTGSSMPIMSAAIASSSSCGRLFRLLRVELGRRLLPGRRLGSSTATSTPSSAATARPSSGGLVELVLGAVQIVLVAAALAALENAGYQLLVG